MKTHQERENKLREIVDEELAEILIKMGFLTCPASTKYHGAYEGGLFDHSLAVSEELVTLSKINEISWENERSPALIGLLHDVCKLDSYKPDCEGFVYKKPSEQDYPIGGHGIKSIVMVQDMFQKAGVQVLNKEEILCIRFHMGAYEKDGWSDFDAAIKKCPGVLWTHHADMIASKIYGL